MKPKFVEFAGESIAPQVHGRREKHRPPLGPPLPARNPAPPPQLTGDHLGPPPVVRHEWRALEDQLLLPPGLAVAEAVVGQGHLVTLAAMARRLRLG